MHMTATGWHRNMGPWQILDQPLTGAKVTRAPSAQLVNMSTASIHVNADSSVQVGWGKSLTLGGNFELKVKLTKEEIVQLFKLAVGETFNPEILKDTGLVVDDATVRDRMRSMSVAQLIDLLTSQPASEADTVGQDNSGEERGEAAE